MPESLDFRILQRLSRIPTASFYEGFVNAELQAIYREQFAGEPKMTARVDTWNNAIWHYQGDPNRTNPKSIANVVHTDHPAFHLTRLHPAILWAKMMGGLNPEIMVGSPLDLHTSDTKYHSKGSIDRVVDEAEGNPSGRYVVITDSPLPQNNFAFATLRFKPGERELVRDTDTRDTSFIGNRLKSPVMDDFSAIAMSIAALREIVDQKLPVDVYTVFHRAEEVGLLGAHAIALERGLPHDTFVFSIENSSYKGKRKQDGPVEELAKMGGGIIIRTGDKTIPEYDPAAITLLRESTPLLEGHLTQERLMTGGTCEAGIYGAHGYRAAGIAVPLTFYHNNGALEGIKHCVPEEIDERDFHAGTALMVAAAQTLSSRPELFGEFKPSPPTEAQQTLRNRVDARLNAYFNEGLWDSISRMPVESYS